MVSKSSIYDDLPEVRYHFPSRYLKLAQSSLNDWIIYYETRKDGGSMSYIATAQLKFIEKDKSRADHFYAYVTNYTPFLNSVP